MNATTTTPERVEVEQRDREAAFEFASSLFAVGGRPGTSRERVAYLSGEHDASGVVQAFARHRIATAQASDAEIARLEKEVAALENDDNEDVEYWHLRALDYWHRRALAAEAESARLREENTELLACLREHHDFALKRLEREGKQVATAGAGKVLFDRTAQALAGGSKQEVVDHG